MVLELAVVLCPMEIVDFFQGVPNELWFQVVRNPSMFSYLLRSQFHTQLVYTAYYDINKMGAAHTFELSLSWTKMEHYKVKNSNVQMWLIDQSCIKLGYGNRVCGIFKGGIQNYKGFCIRINIPKGNFWILRIGLAGSLSS